MCARRVIRTCSREPVRRPALPRPPCVLLKPSEPVVLKKALESKPPCGEAPGPPRLRLPSERAVPPAAGADAFQFTMACVMLKELDQSFVDSQNRVSIR